MTWTTVLGLWMHDGILQRPWCCPYECGCAVTSLTALATATATFLMSAAFVAAQAWTRTWMAFVMTSTTVQRLRRLWRLRRRRQLLHGLC